MKNKSILSKTILYVSLLAFISFVIYILYINQEVLYTAHDRSEFLYGTPFFHTLLSKPFGLIQYVGAWLTQFFYVPALGSCILMAIWALIFFVGIKAFRLKGNAVALILLPIACLLTSTVDLGYWIYTITIRGYWFSQSVGFLVMLLLLWAARSTPRKWHVLWYLIAFCVYPVLGWFALLFILCLIVSEKPTWRELVGVVVLIFTTGVWRGLLYANQKYEYVLSAGFPIIENPSDKTEYLSMPFWILGALSILITISSRYLSKWFVPVLCAVASILFTSSLMFHDRNYINEMRMARYALDDNWQEVLKIAEETPKPTVSMVVLKNIALMNEGGLLDRSFKLRNDGAPIYNPDSLHVSFLEIAAPVAYYNYGMINEAFRLSFECGVQSGFCPYYLKMLARGALANGEDRVVERYTSLLQKHPFYGDWRPAPVSQTIKELHHAYPDELSGIENSDSYIVNSICFWHESDSKVASEQALFYSMLRRDAKNFWASLRNYAKLHMNEQFPVHAQEAYILFIDKAPEEKRMMLPVEKTVYDRYNQFWESMEKHAKPGSSLKELGEDMRKEWGDTYWWYFAFGR